MADVTIQIDTPVLIVGEKFKVRYRESPSGAWSAYQDETNAAFTISGLSDGYYDLEVILVKADGSECPATYKTFEVVTEFPCWDFDAEMIEDNGFYFIQVTYSPTSPWVYPDCGFEIKIGNTTIPYLTLPASPFLLPVSNVATTLTITANSCNNNKVVCFEDDITPVDEPCIPIVLTGTTAIHAGTYPSGAPNIVITHTYNQSTPCTKTLDVICNQINTFSGVPAQVTQTFPTTCGIVSVAYGLVPNTNVQWVAGEQKKYEFQGVLIDDCGVSHPFSVSITI